jgi:transposase-like protein
MFMYAKGMSTRDIQEHFEEAYGAELSPAAITHITNSVMAQAVEWQNRGLDSTYPIVFFDAVFLKIREEMKVVTKAAYTCLAIRCDGTKELLGIWLGDTESAAFWAGVMTELKNRGVRDILIACVDGITGFADAMHGIFPETKIQRCIIHQLRRSFRLVTWKDQKAVAVSMKGIYTAPTKEAAEVALDSLEEQWGKKYPSLITSWRTSWPDLSTFLKYPDELRRVMYTTNAVENYHRQVRKVTKNKGAFPSDESARKLMYLNHLQLSKKWTVAIPNWPIIYSYLHLSFGERLPKLENRV